MSRWPNFFIVGTARAGTTSLYYHLKGHPDIYMPEIKEPHFFARVHPKGKLRLRSSLSKVVTEEDDYLKLFEDAGDETAIGEASADYLYDEGAPLRIRERVPNARIIILLRDPVERAHSQYLMTLRLGLERKPFYEALREDHARLQKGLGLSDLYVEFGLYYEQVKRYLATFGPKQVRIYLYEDLESGTAGLVEDVCIFLDVPFHEGRFFAPNKKHLAYRPAHSRLIERIMAIRLLRLPIVAVLPSHLAAALRDRLLAPERPKPPVDQQAREFIRSACREDTLKLQRLIGRDLGGWLG